MTDLYENFDEKTRADLRATFLASCQQWADADVISLQGDASRRRYFRLKRDASPQTAILMDAPRALGEDVTAFVNVTSYLESHGLNPPSIYAQNDELGFLLLEDFGNDLFDHICAQQPELEWELYQAATDVLIHLHNLPVTTQNPSYVEQMPQAASTIFDWYVYGITGERNAKAKSELNDLLQAAFSQLTFKTVTCLRDYHAQNLLWLPAREGLHKIGLLDYQDAAAAPNGYDLISLFKDARRDVSPELVERGIRYYCRKTGEDEAAFRHQIALCSAQRNLRILMVFARMSLAYAKPHYVDLIGRVWDHLQADLMHPELKKLADFVAKTIPKPTPEALSILKEKVGACPIQ